MKDSAYESSDIQKDIYSKWRTDFDEFFPSEQYFFKNGNNILFDGVEILDIGCSAGGLGNALINEFNDIEINYTGVDVDEEAIELGSGEFPELDLVCGRFPDDIPNGKTFDLVTMFGLFPQIPKWKEMLSQMSNYSRKYINISGVFRESGTTVVDKDTSFVYYLDSGERKHQVVHNIYELINYCLTENIGANEVSLYGYHSDEPTSTFRAVPRNEQISGNLLIQLPENDLGKPIGGISHEGAQNSVNDNINVFEPEIDIIIDGEEFDYK